MQTIWSLIQTISMLTAHHSIADISIITGAELQLANENEYLALYESKNEIRLADGITIGRVDVRKSKIHKRIPFIYLSEIQGKCITTDLIKKHFSDLSAPIPPSNPVPNSSITRYGQYDGKRYVLGFRYSNPDCLYGISQQDE